MHRLKDKVAIVAGAGSIAEGWSNGKATGVLFAREGAKLFAVDRNMMAAQETCDIITSGPSSQVPRLLNQPERTRFHQRQSKLPSCTRQRLQLI